MLGPNPPRRLLISRRGVGCPTDPILEEMLVEASFTRIEEEVQRFWRRHGVSTAARAARRDGLAYNIIQQPLPVVGVPWTEHMRLLVTTDLLARYRMMRGHAVHCQIGWLSHGLRVEVAVEQTMGPAAGKSDLAKFNSACREAVIAGLHDVQALAERLGVWVDPASTYTSLPPRAISAVWGALWRMWDAGRLRQERLVVPICPRCATPLSTAEAESQVVTAEAQSIWILLPWDGEANTYFLAWTPLPWTLVGMVALAAHPDVNYALVETAGHQDDLAIRLLIAENVLNRTVRGDYRLVRLVRGKNLRGARYRPPFTFAPSREGTDPVVLSEDLPLASGTGLLPVVPAHHSLSLALAQANNLPIPELLNDRGNLEDTAVRWRGLSPLQVEPLLIEDLHTRQLLYRQEAEPRQGGLCPFCDTPLLPAVRTVWLVTTQAGDWIVGRNRAWGTPLPIWVCQECEKELCVAGLDQLALLTGRDIDHLESHRPAVDQLTFPCKTCGGTMQRVPLVLDAAFEAATLPLALAKQPGPADLAVGWGDQHEGWLGNLTELAAFLRASPAWNQAAVPSDSKEPGAGDLEQLSTADALRWSAYVGVTPNQAEGTLLRPVWRLVDELAGVQGGSPGLQTGEMQHLFDRWLVTRLHQTISAVTAGLEAGKVDKAAGELVLLVQELLDWYAPHRPGGDTQVLETLNLLLAPFVPHVAEACWRRLRGIASGSVHLQNWPAYAPASIDLPLLSRMSRIRQIAALGQAARRQAGIEPARRLRRAIITLLPKGREAGESIWDEDLLAELLRVAEVQIASSTHEDWRYCLALNPNRVIERDVTIERIGRALAALDSETAADLSWWIWNGLTVSLEVDGQAITLLPDEVQVLVQAGPGWSTAADMEFLVSLETG